MDPHCEMFMNCRKNVIGICKKQIGCQAWNTEGIIDVKELIWLTYVKYMRLSV